MPSNCRKSRKTNRKTRKSGGGPKSNSNSNSNSNSKSHLKKLFDNIKKILIEYVNEVDDTLNKYSENNNASKPLSIKKSKINRLLDEIDSYITYEIKIKSVIDSIKSLLINNIRDLRDDIDDCKDSLENNPSDKMRKKLEQLQEKLGLTENILGDLNDTLD